jgi:hypothetical protein
MRRLDDAETGAPRGFAKIARSCQRNPQQLPYFPLFPFPVT